MKPRLPGLLAMWRAGARGLVEQRRVVVAVYLVELFSALLFTVLVAQVLSGLYADRPLFSRGVAGDPISLDFALIAHFGELGVLAWAAAAWLLAYFVLSLFLTGGLLGALAGQGFGATAGPRFPALLRLAGCAIVPYGLGAIVALRGALATGILPTKALTLGRFFGAPLVGALPGLAILAVTWCAVDYARADLVVGGRGGALRALGRGYRAVVTSPIPLLHYLAYLVAWAAVSLGYVGLTLDRAYAGVAGALLLFALRQLVAWSRLAARVATYAGQVARVRLSHPTRV